MVTVILSAALLCIGEFCYPALIGKETPIGEFNLIERRVIDPSYGGNVIQFKETENDVYSIHRPWRGKPKEQRDKRLKSSNTSRRLITSGCINVEDEVFDALIKCCTNTKIRIIK